MRAVVISVCCAAAGVLLQGCGEGGGSSDTCMAEKPDLVSQSFDSKISTHLSTTTLTTQMDISASFKLDLDKFRLRMDESSEATIMNKTTNIEVKYIVDADAKMVVHSTKAMQGDKVILNQCIAQQVTAMPPAIILQGFFKEAVDSMQANAKCGGNDGKYDTWSFDVSHEGPVPPPGPKGSQGDGTVNEKLQMTKESIIHSTSTKFKFKMTAPNGTVIENVGGEVSMTTSNAKAGGPSDADMDYSGWGDCKAPPSPPPAGEEFDIKPMFKEAATPMEGLGRHGLIMKYALTALKKGVLAKDKTVVV